MEKRISYFDNIKGFLILMVVVGHALDLVTVESLVARTVFLWIYSFHMPLFLFMAGYFSKKVSKNDEKIIQKSFFYFILFLALKVFYYGSYYFFYGDFPYHLSNSFWGEVQIPWYILALSIMTISLFVVRNCKPKIVVSVSLLMAFIVGYDRNIDDMFSMLRIFNLYPFFILGFYLNKGTIEKWRSNLSKKGSIAGCGVLSLALLVIVGALYKYPKLYIAKSFFTGETSYPQSIGIAGGGIRALAYCTSIIMIVAVMSVIPMHKNIFEKLGKRTLQIYFLHYLFISLFGTIVNHFVQVVWAKLILCITFGIILTFLLSIDVFYEIFSFVERSSKVCVTRYILKADSKEDKE